MDIILPLLIGYVLIGLLITEGLRPKLEDPAILEEVRATLKLHSPNGDPSDQFIYFWLYVGSVVFWVDELPAKLDYIWSRLNQD